MPETETRTEYRVIAKHRRTGREFEAYKTRETNVEAAKQEFGWASTERDFGEFERLEARQVIETPWTTVPLQPEQTSATLEA